MILGAGFLQVPLIKCAADIGYDVALVAPCLDEPGFKYATHAVKADVTDCETILHYARKYDINGVITDQTDLPVRTAAYIAEQLSLPGIGYDCACLFTDKYRMREKCRELGIPVLQYTVTKDVRQALDFWRSIGGRVILKPVDNQGSRGCYVVHTAEDLLLKYPWALSYSRSGRVLVEQFVEGREFVVEGIACDYNYKNLIIGDTCYFNLPDVFSAFERTFPSVASAGLQNKVLEMNRKIIEGFGLKQGLTHSEFIVCGGEVYLIETAARGGGVFISSDVVPCLTGIDTSRFLLDIAVHGAVELPVIRNTGKYCGYVAFFLPVGRIVRLEGLSDVLSLPYVGHNNLDGLYLGQLTKKIADKTARYFLIVEGNDYCDLRVRIDNIKEMIHIEVETSDGLQYPIWN